jgi:hypothetical protein
VRVGPELFAPDCSSVCSHAPPEAPYPHYKPNSALWNLPSVMHNSARWQFGLSGGALPTAFRDPLRLVPQHVCLHVHPARCQRADPLLFG